MKYAKEVAMLWFILGLVTFLFLEMTGSTPLIKYNPDGRTMSKEAEYQQALWPKDGKTLYEVWDDYILYGDPIGRR